MRHGDAPARHTPVPHAVSMQPRPSGTAGQRAVIAPLRTVDPLHHQSRGMKRRLVAGGPRFAALQFQRQALADQGDAIAEVVESTGATVAQPNTAAFYGFAAPGLALLILDGIACSISFVRHLQRKRR